MAQPTSARRVALDVLDRVLGARQPLDDTFAGHPRLTELDVRDRAFARLLITTVLRRLGQIDALLAHFLRHRPKARRVRNLLRLGAAQLCFLGTPPHAAVAECVALIDAAHDHARSLVNAVLRRVAREGATIVAEQDAPRLNAPRWLWRSWCDAYGEPVARAIAAAHLAEPPLDLTVKADPEGWAARLDAVALHGLTLRRPSGGLIEALPGFARGAWWVQDVAAALPVRLLGDVRGRAVLDLCAAPGGKTAQLAAAGATVTAVDVSAPRSERLRANLDRLQLRAEIVVADALAWRPPHPAAAALLDAPCTATGTIRRHPDVAWNKTRGDVDRAATLQDNLLAAATLMIEPSGLLVYASCSLQPEEGPEVIARGLARGLPVERMPVTAAELAGLPARITDAGDVRTLPCDLAERGGLDGFFIARLRRRG